MNYIIGILVTLASKLVVSVANVFDGQLSNKVFVSVWSLVTLNGLLLVPVIPIVFFVLQPSEISWSQLSIIALVAFIEFFYQFPYYKALREAETSVVMSLFSFEKIFIPIMAYLWLENG